MKLRIWIVKALWAMAVSFGISFVSGLLSLVLHALGDAIAAQAVHGVTLVSVTLFTLSFIALVVILAVNELLRDTPPDHKPPQSPGCSPTPEN